ncbi:MAG: hypothetical protein HYS38_09450 [Acidobacteria bacterium]|nr:hypothetical protein [Acidobacteriota bacterium]
MVEQVGLKYNPVSTRRAASRVVMDDFYFIAVGPIGLSQAKSREGNAAAHFEFRVSQQVATAGALCRGLLREFYKPTAISNREFAVATKTTRTCSALVSM